MSALYFILGSSGSGKTTLLREVVSTAYPGLAAYHYDDVGTPDAAELDRAGGSAAWQADRVRAWAERAARAGAGDPELLVVDGQARPTHVLEAARQAGLKAVHVLLVDCNHAERRRRLLDERRQPELDVLDIYAWAAYLRGQADALGVEVLDTTGRTVAESTAALAASIEQFARKAGVRLLN